ncbi:MAG: heme biosynthesis protein HemY, partial [Tropicimonas sp.]
AVTDPTARSLSIMAAIERGEGTDDAVVRGWLAKAVTAPRGPQWVCDKCQKVEPNWMPVCSNCGGFDTLSWRSAGQSEISMPTGAEMLPLIVGKPVQAPAESGPATESASTTDPDPAQEADVVDATGGNTQAEPDNPAPEKEK